MNCGNCNGEMPAKAKFCPNCGAAVSSHAGGVSTGGGAYIGGSAAAGGDIVGRDQRVEGGYTRAQQGLQAEDLAKLFQSVYGRIEMHATDPETDTGVLTDTAKKVEQEVAKGENADPEQVRKWLGTLARLAPDVLEVAVNVLTNPGAAVASAVRLVARGFQTMDASTDDTRSN